ncbi:uncharacterized protein JCM15063_000197 [Sporobolomyces koalae]|uniref:uncharacterized protein n=1 Tax=Sporobolomyces koalae TaxID=500713 RepID=UPI00318268A4
MKFTTILLAASIVPAVLASVMPQAVQDQVDQVRFAVEDKLDDPCPDFLVRCIKDDGDIVGDIGNKGMERKGLKCVQKHHKINTAECNAKYPIDCATKCDAKASPI